MTNDQARVELAPGEPGAGPWEVVTLADAVGRLLTAAGDPVGRPALVAVDGRSAAGKSTFARRVQEYVPRCAIVHTDDVAWNESFFDWGPLLRDGVLGPLRAGTGVDFRPPAWGRHGRDGSITVDAGLALVLVEGVGASQRELVGGYDATVWVQSDPAVAEGRGLARDLATKVDQDPDVTVAFWHQWIAEELPFLARDRPWERADLIIAGTPPTTVGPAHVALSPGPLR